MNSGLRPSTQSSRQPTPSFRNWSGCESYFGERCDYYAICHFDSGWDQPETIGFVGRRPHHDPERFQMEARGLPVPEEEDIEDGYGGES